MALPRRDPAAGVGCGEHRLRTAGATGAVAAVDGAEPKEEKHAMSHSSILSLRATLAAVCLMVGGPAAAQTTDPFNAAHPASEPAVVAPAATQAPGEPRVAVTAAPAPTPDEIKVDFARSVYNACAELVHHERPQPLLRAVVVLRLRLDEMNRWRAEVFRDNPTQPEMTQAALDSVARLPAAEALHPRAVEQLRGEGLIEAWLFQTNGRFALKTLAKAQLGVERPRGLTLASAKGSRTAGR